MKARDFRNGGDSDATVRPRNATDGRDGVRTPFGGVRPKSRQKTCVANVFDGRHADVRNKRLADTPETMRRTYIRAMGGKSRPSAVRAMCQQCMGWDRASVTGCTSWACPLWHYRPYQEKA